ALRPHPAHVRVPRLLDGDRPPAPGLDAGELQLLAQDLRELVEVDLRLQDVLAGGRAGRSLHGIAGLTFALADASRLLRPEPEPGDLDLGEGDGYEVLPLLADELALGQVLAELLLDDPADDLLEALNVAFDRSEEHT